MEEASSHMDGEITKAWLDKLGEEIPLTSPFSIGRSSKSSHTIAESDISRKHTLLQYSEQDRKWLVTDLGSTNGTYLNHVRITQPHTLRRGDLIGVASHQFVFQMESELGSADPPTQTTAVTHSIDPETLVTIEWVECYLLVADIEGSTRLSQVMPQEELSAKVRLWAGECDAIVRGSKGIVNELMGDGLLAFWRQKNVQPEDIINMLSEFNDMESRSGLKFRVLLHHGVIGFGGGVSSGIEKLGGAEVNYVFKMEKSASLSGAKVNLTESAVQILGPGFETVKLGEFEISGFKGLQNLYTPAD